MAATDDSIIFLENDNRLNDKSFNFDRLQLSFKKRFQILLIIIIIIIIINEF
jgi:hypothetical protein